MKEIEEESVDDDELLKVIAALNSGVWSDELKRYKICMEQPCTIGTIVLHGFRIVNSRDSEGDRHCGFT